MEPAPDPFADLPQIERFASWLERYHETLFEQPVCSRARPGEVYEALPGEAPEEPEDFEAIERDLDAIVLPALTHWQHPSFFAFFPANASAPAILGDLLSSGLGVQGMLWQTSPACTELEMRMCDWMARAIGLPGMFTFEADAGGGGVIQGTASEATLSALHAARRRALVRAGLLTTPRSQRPDLVLYASAQAHSSVVKAAMIAGLADGPEDTSQVRLVPVREDLSMDPEALEAMLREDIDFGRLPFFVCATLGTTSTLAFDEADAIASACERAGADCWLHADGAHALSACVCEEHRWMLRGIERFDSVCFNPHKWLLTNFDCDLFYTRDRASLIDAMSITPEYLRNRASESQGVVDYRDWHVPLGRRFRALKLWLVLRRFGLRGLRAHIRSGVELCAHLERLVRNDPRLTVPLARRLNLLCLRPAAREGESPEQLDARTLRLRDAINDSGRAYLTHTSAPIDGRDSIILRVAIGAGTTRREHVDALYELLRGLVDRV